MQDDALPSVFDRHAQTQDQIILHVDMDCFYAACERLREPELQGEPLVIGMGYDKENPSGAVATASYEAREYGIESAQPISTALDRLPRKTDVETEEDQPAAYYRPVDMEYYQSISEDVREILREYADVIRIVSIDEAYLDITSSTDWTGAEQYGSDLKTKIYKEVGVVASVGIAPTMSAAKIASDHDKPDGLTILNPGEVQEFLAPLDIEAIHGIGPVRAAELRDEGIETAGDLAEATPEEITAKFGEHGQVIYDRVRGIDPREVTPTGRPKSLSRETSMSPLTDYQRKQAIIRQLAEQVSERAAAKGAQYRTIGIKVVETPYNVNTREQTLPGPVDDPKLVEETALSLLPEFKTAEVRKLGVRVSNLVFFTGEQLRFDEWEPPETVIADDSTRLPLGQTRIRDYIPGNKSR